MNRQVGSECSSSAHCTGTWPVTDETWRCERLDLTRGRYVRVPIRHGRRSEKRQSYTMVFSTSVGANDYGPGIENKQDEAPT